MTEQEERWTIWVCPSCGRTADETATKPLACDVLHGPETSTRSARAVTEPRRFHENEDGRQQALSARLSEARSLVTHSTPPKETDA